MSWGWRMARGALILIGMISVMSLPILVGWLQSQK